jgi:hypothetical protein
MPETACDGLDHVDCLVTSLPLQIDDSICLTYVSSLIVRLQDLKASTQKLSLESKEALKLILLRIAGDLKELVLEDLLFDQPLAQLLVHSDPEMLYLKNCHFRDRDGIDFLIFKCLRRLHITQMSNHNLSIKLPSSPIELEIIGSETSAELMNKGCRPSIRVCASGCPVPGNV